MKSMSKALPVIAAALALGLAPAPPLQPSAWMASSLVLPDGPMEGQTWDARQTPYVADIVDALGPDSPHNMVAVRKSAQTGISIAAIGLVGAYMAKAPCRIGYALPTIDALREFNSGKLTPSIDASPALREVVREQTSRSAEGSTVTRKAFRGGSLRLLNANSAKDLKSKTLKVGIGDEVDEWPPNLDDQGEPWALYEKRFTAFHATGDYRLLALSTPTADGTSRIDRMYAAGDQRLWHVTCPGCRTEIVLEFEHLRYEPKPPYRAYYAAQCCGHIVEHGDKARLVRGGRFIATNSDGLYPSFHVDAMASQFTTWDKIAAEFVEAEGDELKLKAFYNQTLGRTYRVRGDAPDHGRLYERREDYEENRIPPQALLVTAGVDVQHKGLWLEVVAWAPDAQSWTVSSRYLSGDTSDPNLGAWKALAAVYDERFVDAWGNQRLIEAFAIDAGDGGRANQVYAWCGARDRAYAIKGMPQWGRPAFGPTATTTAVKVNGRRIGKGELWPVGTWDLKSGFYDDLRKDGRRAGAETDPPGYCHHGTFLDEGYFRQVTAEHLVDSRRNGRIVKVWTVSPGIANHLLDSRIYARAVAEHLGLTRMTRDQWRRLAQKWQVPVQAGDLFAPPTLAVQRTVPEAETAVAELEAAIAAKPSSPVRRTRRVRSKGI